MHGQEIHLVAELGNQCQLVRHLLLHGMGHAIRVTMPRAFMGVMLQSLRRAHAGQHSLYRVLVAQLIEVEAAARNNDQRIG